MKPVRALSPMTADARATLELMADLLEQIAERGKPLSAVEYGRSCLIVLNAADILSEFDSSTMDDETVQRLRAAVDNLEQIPGGRTWVN
jgi:hypothetical protein